MSRRLEWHSRHAGVAPPSAWVGRFQTGNGRHVLSIDATGDTVAIPEDHRARMHRAEVRPSFQFFALRPHTAVLPKKSRVSPAPDGKGCDSSVRLQYSCAVLSKFCLTPPATSAPQLCPTYPISVLPAIHPNRLKFSCAPDQSRHSNARSKRGEVLRYKEDALQYPFTAARVCASVWDGSCGVHQMRDFVENVLLFQ